MTKVKTECTSCRGTGLYVGVAEPSGTAVICLTCGGTGCHELSYTPFTKRKRKSGIVTVRRSEGSSVVTGLGATGYMSYEEWERGI
jgi:hypothetical protein